MKEPIIFGHRGASGYCIENTINSFKKAVEMNASIETDIRLTKDKILICFHDPGFKIKNRWYKINNMTFDQLKKINFEDKREIPSLNELFDCFKPNHYNDLLYSFDIGSMEAGIETIKLAKMKTRLSKIFITETKLKNLEKLRKFDKDVNLVHTVPHNVPKLEKYEINYERLRDLKIIAINFKANRYMKENFNFISKKDFKCFIWGVNSKIRMKKALTMNKDGHIVDAIYTDYPEKLYRTKSNIIN